MNVNMNHYNYINNVLQKTTQNQTRLTFNILSDNYPSLAVEPENSTLVSVVAIKTNAETEILSLNQAAAIQCSDWFKFMNKNLNASKIITECE